MITPRTRRAMATGLACVMALSMKTGCAVRVVPLADARDDAALSATDAAVDPMAPDDRPAATVDAPSAEDRPPTATDSPPAVDVPTTTGRGGVDLLVVVDNSNSMRAGQDLLNANLGPLVLNLLARQGVRDVHVGVVSSDLGADGASIPSCGAVLGDDAVLNPRTRGAAVAMHPPGDGPAEIFCTPAVRAAPFLSLSNAVDAMAVYWSPACHSNLGLGGCGLEQPLEAALRALTTQASPGAPNAGFLRPEATLAVLLLTDEDDGSVRDCRRHDGVGPCDDARDVYQASSTRWGSPDLNLRLYDFAPGSAQDPTWPLERYVDPARPTRGLLGLKPGHPERIVFGAITGVPTAMPRTPDGSPDWDALLGPAPAGRPDDFAARDERLAYTAAGAPEGPVSMRQREADPACPQRLLPACRQAQTAPSCSLATQPIAWRARRIAEVARRFDVSALCAGGPCRNGMVASLCAHTDTTPFQRFAEMIARRVGP
jgi:hypothetical protein